MVTVIVTAVIACVFFFFFFSLPLASGDIIVDRRKIPNPEAYALFTVVDGHASVVDDNAYPQEIKLEWTLRRTLGAAKMQPTSSQFFAYKLRTPDPII